MPVSNAPRVANLVSSMLVHFTGYKVFVLPGQAKSHARLSKVLRTSSSSKRVATPPVMPFAVPCVSPHGCSFVHSKYCPSGALTPVTAMSNHSPCFCSPAASVGFSHASHSQSPPAGGFSWLASFGLAGGSHWPTSEGHSRLAEGSITC